MSRIQEIAPAAMSAEQREVYEMIVARGGRLGGPHTAYLRIPRFMRLAQDMGDYLRRFWTPALACSKLPEPDCDPVEVRLLGQDFVAFRDTDGKVGIIDALCPHRQAPMYYGRNEEHGLRCIDPSDRE